MLLGLRSALFFLLVMFHHSILGETLPTQLQDDEISGFTIDQTITRVGHDFARYLAEYRNNSPNPGRYNLTVYERPSARWGNLIWVMENHKQVYRRFIQPGNNKIRSISEEAGKSIHATVNRLKIQALFSDKFDLEQDEF